MARSPDNVSVPPARVMVPAFVSAPVWSVAPASLSEFAAPVSRPSTVAGVVRLTGLRVTSRIAAT